MSHTASRCEPPDALDVANLHDIGVQLMAALLREDSRAKRARIDMALALEKCDCKGGPQIGFTQENGYLNLQLFCIHEGSAYMSFEDALRYEYAADVLRDVLEGEIA